MYIYGKITKMSKDRRTGKVYITRGNNAGQEINFTALAGIMPPIRHNTAVRLMGHFTKDNTFTVDKVNGIVKEITATDVVALGISQDMIERAIEAAGVNTVYELYTDEGAKDKITSAIGEDTAYQLFSALNTIIRDSEVLNVYNIFIKSGVGLDITDVINITDQLKYTAARQKKTVEELILQNPWILHRIPDIGVTDMLHICDCIAETFNIMPGLKRIEGCLTSICIAGMKNGNTYIDRDLLVSRAAAYLKTDLNTISQALYESKFLTQEKGDSVGAADNKTAVYISPVYFMEKAAIEKIALILKTKEAIPIDADKLVSFANEWGTAANTPMDEKQTNFIKAVAEHKITLLTGKAGSGKSTAVKGLLYALKMTGIQYAVLAPTGIAAQRVAAETGSDYYTVHRYAGIIDSNVFDQQLSGKTEEPADVIIIDEMSMMTVNTFSALLSVIKPTSKLVLAGDPAQLPPIGPGGVFDALIMAAKDCGLAHIDLENSYRMKDNINYAANTLRDTGYLEPNDGIKIIEAQSWQEAADKTVKTVTELVRSGVSYDDILVLARKRGNIREGTICLNQKLKQAINPSNDRMSVKDPVIATRNDYEDTMASGIPSTLKKQFETIRKERANRPTIFNGTRGIIIAANDETVTINYKTPTGEITADYNPVELLWYIEPAYAMSVHKAQGGKSKYVIFADPEAQKCSRNMLYTALSRCSGTNMILIGSGWDNEFKVITPNSRFDKKLWETINGFIEECEEPAVQLIE
jgi:exodeoxyribonuclease V alpha subunit